MRKLLGCFIFAAAFSAHANELLSFTAKPSTFAFIDLLVWQMQEGGADDWAQNIPLAGTSVPIEILATSFNWHSGVRVGIGRLLENSDNDFTAVFTHYNTQANSQASGHIASSFDGNYFANNTNGASFGPSYRNASINWQFYYNVVDLNLGHQFVLDKFLQIHPYLGIRSASIKQNINTNWYNPINVVNFSSATENLTNNFFGIGPSIGMDSTWPLYTDTQQHFNLIGNFVGALMYGRWSFSDVYTNNLPVTINVPVDNVNGAAPMAGGQLGIQWVNEFAHSRISLGISYEAQIWFSQIQYYSLNGGRLNRPTTLQGVDFEFRYHF